MTAPIRENLSGLDLRAEIERLRKERNAVILAHYYQKPEIQDHRRFRRRFARAVAQGGGDRRRCHRLLRREVHGRDRQDPEPRQDRHPARHGRRLLAGGQLPARPVRAFRDEHPDHIALTYINCSAAVKALSATSSSPRRSPRRSVARSPMDQKIIFGPDRHLGGYLNRKFGREMLLWPGVCIVHEAFSETELIKLKAQHPGAPVAAHPECPPHILDHADYVGSTSGILQFAKDIRRRHADRRDRAAHHPPDGKGGAGKDLHRCAGCRRQLQLQHLPVHGAQHDGKALRRAARPEAADRDGGRRCGCSAQEVLDRMLEMATGTVGKGDLGRA